MEPAWFKWLKENMPNSLFEQYEKDSKWSIQWRTEANTKLQQELKEAEELNAKLKELCEEMINFDRDEINLDFEQQLKQIKKGGE